MTSSGKKNSQEDTTSKADTKYRVDTEIPVLVYIKWENGFMSRAYTPEQMNFDATPPPGVKYVPFSPNQHYKTHKEGKVHKQ